MSIKLACIAKLVERHAEDSNGDGAALDIAVSQLGD